LHHEIGLSVPNREEAQVKRAMINASAQVVALAIAEKIGTAETFIVGELRDIDVLVTDSAAPVEVLQWYTRSGIEVL
jgi:DeoR family fructose operon transcriptional repressor